MLRAVKKVPLLIVTIGGAILVGGGALFAISPNNVPNPVQVGVPGPTTMHTVVTIPSVGAPVPAGTVTSVTKAQAIQDALNWIPTVDPQAPTPTVVTATLITQSQAEVTLQATSPVLSKYLWRVDVNGAIHMPNGTFSAWSIFVDAENGQVVAYHYGNTLLPQ